MANDPHKKEVDSVTGVETTGHDWDGIKELNTPAPRWWLWVWFATIIFSIGYWVVYPTWPTLSGYSGGSFHWSQYSQLKEHQAEITAMRAKYEGDFAKASLAEIKASPELYDYGRSGGAIAFKTNCAACHGSGAQGGVGYPNLNDDDWIWGGSIEQIYATIHYGAHNANPSSRQSQMPAWGKDGLLKAEEIDQVAEYVQKLHLGDKAEKTAAYEQGKTVYAANCAACHGDKGDGNQEMGSPRLNDDIWLYGGTLENIKATIYGGRAGVMPDWSSRLDDSTIKKLAVYVHSLGGGQ